MRRNESRKSNKLKIISFVIVLVLVLVLVCIGISSIKKVNFSEEFFAPENMVQNFTKTDVDGIYLLDKIKIEPGMSYSSVALSGRIAAFQLANFSGETKLKVINLVDFSTIYEKDYLQDQRFIGIVSEKYVYSASTEKGQIEVYDTKGNIKLKYDGLNQLGPVYADENGNLWTFANGNKLYKMFEGQKTEYDVRAKGTNLHIVSVENNKVYYTYYTTFQNFAEYDLVTGNIQVIQQLEDFRATKGLIYNCSGESFKYSLDKKSIFEAKELNSILPSDICFENGIIYVTLNEEIGIIDTVNKTYKLAKIPNIYLWNIVVDDSAMMFVGATSNDELFVYYAKDIGVEEKKFETNEITLHGKQIENLKKADEIYNEYDLFIHVLPLEKGDTLNYVYETQEKSTDDEVSEFLDKISIELKKFPKNFFSEMKKGKFNGVEIFLSGDLVGIGDNTIDSAAGLTDMKNDGIAITITTGFMANLSSTLPHELMHAIEKIVQINNANETAFSRWNELNPAGFEYANNYSSSYVVNTKYTWYYDRNAWFTDEYAKRYATEDKARIFEYMMQEPYYFYFDSPHLKAKAKYIAEELRRLFPAWYEDPTFVPEWEKCLK